MARDDAEPIPAFAGQYLFDGRRTLEALLRTGRRFSASRPSLHFRRSGLRFTGECKGFITRQRGIVKCLRMVDYHRDEAGL